MKPRAPSDDEAVSDETRVSSDCSSRFTEPSGASRGPAPGARCAGAQPRGPHEATYKGTKGPVKEYARLLRKRAYEREKARRAADPKFIAAKEAMKLRQRQLYQREKERRKAARAEEKSKKRSERAEERARADFELMKMIKRATKGSSAEN